MTLDMYLGRALGYPDSEDGLPSSIVDKALSGTREIHAKPDCTHVPSMLLDAQKGQPIEVEVIVGEVIRMAKAHNVETPVSLRPQSDRGASIVDCST